MARSDGDGKAYWKYAGLGLEFAGVIGIFGYFGYLADRRYGTGTRWTLIGGGIGFVGGLYWLIKEGYRMMAELDRRKGEGDSGSGEES